MGSNGKGPGPSSVLIGADRAGSVVGIDPHKRTLTAIVIDGRRGVLAGEHFRVSGDGPQLEAWALSLGPVACWAWRTRPAGPPHRDLPGRRRL
jgi:hypothetical protein